MLNTPWFFAGRSSVVLPEDLIIGLKAGAEVPPEWVSYTSAYGKCICATTTSALLETSAAAENATFYPEPAGGHRGEDGQTEPVAETSYYSQWDRSRIVADPNDAGEHYQHLIEVGYSPPGSDLKLIQATQDTSVPENGVMFKDGADTGHEEYALLNDAGGILRSESQTLVRDESMSVLSVGEVLDEHNHTYYRYGKGPNYYPAYTNADPLSESHDHGIAELHGSQDLTRIALRAFQLIDKSRITGLIGLWPNAVIPAGWAIVGSATEHFIELTSSATGGTSGSNRVAFTGETDERAHSHTFSGYYTNRRYVSQIGHSDNISHKHQIDALASCRPARFFLHLIKHTG